MLSALLKAFGQLDDPRLRRLVWLSLGLAVAVVALLTVGAWFVVTWLADVSVGWIDTVVEVFTGLGLLLLVWFLFPAAVSITVGLFVEPAAAAVEARHYPGLGPARAQPVAEAIVEGLRFGAVALLLNVLALPVYVAAFFFPPLYFLVFYGLNGYLLGREYFETVALRRLDPTAARELRQRQRGRLFWAGVIITLLLTVPFLNLIAPLLATAFMVHLLQAMRRRNVS